MQDEVPDAEVPALLSEQIKAVTDEGHFATLMAAMGRRIGEIHAELSEEDIDLCFSILGEAIEAGRIEAINQRTTN